MGRASAPTLTLTNGPAPAAALRELTVAAVPSAPPVCLQLAAPDAPASLQLTAPPARDDAPLRLEAAAPAAAPVVARSRCSQAKRSAQCSVQTPVARISCNSRPLRSAPVAPAFVSSLAVRVTFPDTLQMIQQTQSAPRATREEHSPSSNPYPRRCCRPGSRWPTRTAASSRWCRSRLKSKAPAFFRNMPTTQVLSLPFLDAQRAVSQCCGILYAHVPTPLSLLLH